MSRPVVVIATPWSPADIQAASELGYEIRRIAAALPGLQRLAAEAAGAAVLVLDAAVEVADELLDRLAALEVLVVTGPQVSVVDVEACSRRRIPVLRVPDAAAAVAELGELSRGEPLRSCVNPDRVLPITPPLYFAQMRVGAEFRAGMASRESGAPGPAGQDPG